MKKNISSIILVFLANIPMTIANTLFRINKMSKRNLGLFLTTSMLMSLLTVGVFADSVTEVIVDTTSYNGWANGYNRVCLGLNGLTTDSNNNSKINGDANGCYACKAQNANTKGCFKIGKLTGTPNQSGTSGAVYSFASATTPMYISVDVYGTALTDIWFSLSLVDISSTVTSSMLDSGKWTTVSVIYYPNTVDNTKLGYADLYVGGKYISTKDLSTTAKGSNANECRINIKASDTATNTHFDNIKVYALDSFQKPELYSNDYIENGEIVGFYGMTAAELREKLEMPSGIKLSFVDEQGNDIKAENTTYLFGGMKVIATNDSLGFSLKEVYPMASGQSYIEKAIEEISVPTEITSDIVLPTKKGRVSIAWSSNVPSIISNIGNVNRPQASDVVVTLTAVYKDDFQEKTVTYDVVVKSQGQPTSVSAVNVSLSASKAKVGESINYDVKQVDDYGEWNVRYTVSSDDDGLIIDTKNKTISASSVGTYKVKFTGIDTDFEISEVIKFSTSGISITDFKSDRAYADFLLNRQYLGHYFGSNGIGGKSTADSFMTAQGQDGSKPSAFSLGDKSKSRVNINKLDEIAILSFEVYHNNILDYLYITNSSNQSVISKNIYSTELSGNAWDLITVVYKPCEDGGILTETYINNEFHSSKYNEDGVDDVRIAFRVYADKLNTAFYFDSFKLITVDEFQSPELSNGDYVQNGEIVEFYEKKAAELRAELETPGIKVTFNDEQGNSVQDTAYLFTGMNAVVSTDLLGVSYKRIYPLASGQSYIEKAIKQVSLPAEITSGDITLPTEIGKASVKWSSSVPTIISNTGKVNRPQASDVVVTLTAVYTDVLKEKTVTYDVVVKSLGYPTSVSSINVMLSTKNAKLGESVLYNLRQVDDYGSWDLRYTVSSDDELIIDTKNKTISASSAGVYRVKFTGIDTDFEINEVIAFGTDGSHQVLSSTEVYRENFDGVEYDRNAIITNSTVTSYNGSKAMYATSNGLNQSESFGPIDGNGKVIPLSDYTVDADVFVDKSVGTSTQNFTIRLRDNGTHTFSKTGYNFSFMDYAYLSETNPGKIGTSVGDDYVKYSSVFGLSRGYGGTVHTWHFGETKQILDVYNATSRAFNKSYHIKCTIIGDTASAKIFDGNKLLSTQVVNLSDLDNGEERILSGCTRFITEYTGGYVDNIVISKPVRWINSIKIELGDSIVSPSNPTTSFKVLGKSENGAWIELNDNEYTLVPSDATKLSVADGEITVNSEGVYSIGAYVGDLCCVADISCDTLNAEKKALDNILIIDNADRICEDFQLPNPLGYTLSWEISDNTFVTISGNTAKITRPDEGSANANVNLTVTAYSDTSAFAYQKSIPIVILAKTDNAMILDTAISQVTIPSTTTTNLTLPTYIADGGVAISWSSNNVAVISNTGTVTRMPANSNVTLVALYSKDGVSKTVSYIVNVPGILPIEDSVPVYPRSSGGSVGISGQSQPSGNSSMKFADVKSDSWYYKDVLRLYKLGIVSGVSEGEFQPERNVKREEFIKALCSAAKIPLASANNFNDVSGENWYVQYVGGAVKAGIVSGVSDTLFGVGLQISRQDMCVMIKNALEYNGIVLNAGDYELFEDSNEIAEYARESVYVLRKIGIVNGKGDNMFSPTAPATRAEMSTIILRMLDKMQ